MTGLFDSNRTDSLDNSYAKLVGATDNTEIGNIGNRLLVNSTGTVEVSSLNNLDLFGRLRISRPFSKFDFSFANDINSADFTSAVVSGGTATYNATTKTVSLACTTTLNSTSTFQSLKYHKYYPGKSNLVFISANIKSHATNVTKRLGLFDDNNGYFFEFDGTNAKVAIRSKISGSVVDTTVNQSSWNLDTLNGSGTSGVTLDLSKQHIFCINYQWLGTGRVMFGLYIGNSIIWCHQFSHANSSTTIYSQTATLPIRVSIKNNTATASTLELSCGTLISEGEESFQGRLLSVSNGSVVRNFSTTGTRIPILTIRKQTAYLDLGLLIIGYGFFFNSSDNFLVEIVKNGTITGATYNNVTNSYMQLDVAATAISGGTTMISGYGTGNSSANTAIVNSILSETSNITIGTNLDGTSETLSLVATNLTASAKAYGYINYKELI